MSEDDNRLPPTLFDAWVRRFKNSRAFVLLAIFTIVATSVLSILNGIGIKPIEVFSSIWGQQNICKPEILTPEELDECLESGGSEFTQ